MEMKKLGFERQGLYSRKFLLSGSLLLVLLLFVPTSPVYAVSDGFVNCSNSGSIKIVANHVVRDTDSANICRGNVVIPNGVVAIDEFSFEFSAIETITIPSSVTTLGAQIFDNYENPPHLIFQGNAPSSVDTNTFRTWNGSIYIPIPGISATVGIDSVGFNRPYWNDLPITFSGVPTKPYLYYIARVGSDRGIGRTAIDLSSRIDTFWEEDTPAYYDGGLTVRDDYIYWTSSNSIVRARIDGSGVKETIYSSDTPGTNLSGVATFGEYLYWGDLGRKAIGRSLLNGNSPNPDFITDSGNTTNDTYGIYVNSEFIYWANFDSNTIGRAKLDGTEKNSSFITIAGSGPCSIWATDTKLYWTSYNTGDIGSSDIDGTNVNPIFINRESGSGPFYLVGDSTNIYWTNLDSDTISKADINGSNVISDYLSVDDPVGVWIVHPESDSDTSDESGTGPAAEFRDANLVAIREAEKRAARAELLTKVRDGKELTLELLTKSEISGITRDNFAEFEGEIRSLAELSLLEINQVLKVARKYEVVGIIASERVITIYSNSLIEIGLIPRESRFKATLTRVVRGLSQEERSSYTRIQAAIETELLAIQGKQARLTNILNLITSRRKG